jgi:RES domain
VLPERELREALLDLFLPSASGPWSRVVGNHLLQGPPPGGAPGDPPEPLWVGGPASRGARFTRKGGFPSVYLASDPITAYKEVHVIFPGLTIPSQPWTLLTVTGSLEGVLDLTDPSVQGRLGTSLAELTGDWRYSQDLYLEGKGPLPPTQVLGQIAYETSKVMAIRYHSVKNLGQGFCLAIFPDRLSGSSCLEVFDPHGLIRQRLP